MIPLFTALAPNHADPCQCRRQRRHAPAYHATMQFPVKAGPHVAALSRNGFPANMAQPDRLKTWSASRSPATASRFPGIGTMSTSTNFTSTSRRASATIDVDARFHFAARDRRVFFGQLDHFAARGAELESVAALSRRHSDRPVELPGRPEGSAGWRYGTALPIEREAGNEISSSPLADHSDRFSRADRRNFKTSIWLPANRPHYLHIAADSERATAHHRTKKLNITATW